jgi:predicted anti-sigma-YlaC factor YlaD
VRRQSETFETTGHVGDGDLLRFIDRECDEGDQQRIMRHLYACAACRKAHEALVATSLEVVDALGHPEESPPNRVREAVLAPRRKDAFRRRRDRMWQRLAAVAAGLLVILVAAPGVRAWIADAFRPMPEQPVAATSNAGNSAVAQARRVVASVAFEPAADVLRVVIRAPQAAGVLTIAANATTQASARIYDHAGDASVLVTPTGFTFNNTVASTADYAVSVPASVRVVRVAIGGMKAIRVVLADVPVGDTVTVSLGTR